MKKYLISINNTKKIPSKALTNLKFIQGGLEQKEEKDPQKVEILN